MEIPIDPDIYDPAPLRGKLHEDIRNVATEKVEVTIQTTRAVQAMLRQLSVHGLYGTSVEQVAEELLRLKLRELRELKGKL